MALALAIATPAAAQSQTDREKMAAQQELAAAESAVATAQAAGAATLAPTLLEEATWRLDVARRDWNSSNRTARHDATLRAVEAGHAARAAEAQAILVGSNNEIRTLRTAISSSGGTPVAVTLYDPPANISRGANSMDRVIIAENALTVARTAGGASVAPTVLKHAEDILGTARTLARRQNQSTTADHLAFVAEMLARRAEFMARHNGIAHLLPTLRDERTRLAGTVQTQQPIVMFDTGRDARIAAERELDLVQRRYEAAVRDGNLSRAEVDALRRQIDQQSATLNNLLERERESETIRGREIQSLESALARERDAGRLNADALAQREQEIRRQRDELDRLRREREESERIRASAFADAQRLRVEAAQESAELRDQVAAERARAEQTAAELERARQELARRDAANQQRIATMQAELAKLAETRTSDRGFIVTLPGLFFATGQSSLQAGARNALARIADQLRNNPDVRIAIEGHTDSVGSEQLNQTLSERRANAVRDYLVSRGLPAERMTTIGLGQNAPVASNDTAAGRQQNRRVELIITQQQQQ
jgi:outer membrane protein OmpA-like peptidoglycan-associated protein